MRILVTGGLGFIGTKFALLTRALTDHELVLVDNLSVQVHGVIPRVDAGLIDVPGVTIVRGDAGDSQVLDEVLPRVDAIVHLAAETGTAQSMYEVSRYNRVNSQGTAAILDWLANHPHSVRKMVLASSRSIYGEGAYQCDTHGEVFPTARSAGQLAEGQWEPVCPECRQPARMIATRESARPSPASIYAATKYAQEDLVRIAGQALGIGTVILRLQNVYGAGQSLKNPYTGILSIFSTRIRQGVPLPIFEDGRESRDFVNVHDVVKAFLLALERDEADGAIINIGSGVATSVYDVASRLVQALGGSSALEITGQYRVGDIRHCYADIGMAGQRLGFAPEVSLTAGLESFARWVLGEELPEDQLDAANAALRKRRLLL